MTVEHPHSHYSNPFGDGNANVIAMSRPEPTPATIHPIALPGNMLPDLNVGAKPVLPGSMAPQFRSLPPKGSSSSQITPITAPILETNAPSGTDNDPFADLL